MLILNLDLDYYRGWVEVIVYPDEFVAEYDYVDEDGVAHHVREPMTGESWLKGPVILSWADAEQAGSGSGYNVVIHEFAHKLDMLNGDANGFPPLHPEMSRAAWSGAFERRLRGFLPAGCDAAPRDPDRRLRRRESGRVLRRALRGVLRDPARRARRLSRMSTASSRRSTARTPPRDSSGNFECLNS